MLILKRFCGILLVLMGAAGVIAGGAGVYKTRAAEKYLLQFSGKAFDAAEGVVAGVRDRLKEIDLSLIRVRSQLKEAVSRGDELQRGGTETKVLADDITRALDREIGEKAAEARALMDSAVISMDAVSHFLNQLETAGLVPDEILSGDSTLISQVEGASMTLNRLAGLLEGAEQTVRDLQRDPGSEQGLLKLRREVGRMDKGLGEVKTLESDFTTAAGKVKNRLLHYQEKTVRWIHLGGILIPILLVWLGAGQTALIILGVRLCVRK